jgi:uncharacterized membrane protein YdfJ with MMPL/SSD domain
MFACPGRCQRKEMGSILGIAVLLDALLVRLMLVPIRLRLTTGRLVVAAARAGRALRALTGPA